MNTNEQLWTYTLTTTQSGWYKIPVNKTFHNNYSTNSWSIFFGVQGFDLPDIMDKSVDLDDTSINCCNMRIRGACLENDGTYTFTNYSSGLSAIFNIICSWDAIVCQNKNVFARPYWYLHGIELLTEQLYSNKLNQFTTIGLNQADELRKEYQVEYMKALEQISNGFTFECDCCIECSGGVQLREANQFY
jgi:hypothetical protein